MKRLLVLALVLRAAPAAAQAFAPDVVHQVQQRNAIGAEFSRTIGDPDYLQRLPADTYFVFDGWSAVTAPVGGSDQTLVYDVGDQRAVKRNVNRFGYSFFAPGVRAGDYSLAAFALTTFTVLRNEDASSAQSFQPTLLPIPDGLMPASFLLGTGLSRGDRFVLYLGSAIDADLGTERFFDPAAARARERSPSRHASVDLFLGAALPGYGVGFNTLPGNGVLRVRVGRLLRFVTTEVRDSDGRAEDDVAVSFLRIPDAKHNDFGVSGTRLFGLLDVGVEADVVELFLRSAWLGFSVSRFGGGEAWRPYDIACRGSIYRDRQLASDDPLRPTYVPGGRCEMSVRLGGGAPHSWFIPVVFRMQIGWNDREALPEIPYTYNMLVVLLNLGFRFDDGASTRLQRDLAKAGR